MKAITNNIYYVGVNDRNKHLFEGLWPLPAGVSYNSYLIDDEKVVSSASSSRTYAPCWATATWTISW